MLAGLSGYVMGADISETLLNFARSKFSKTNNLEFNLCDVQTFKFNTNNFDKVISRFGVMFFEDSYVIGKHLSQVFSLKK